MKGQAWNPRYVAFARSQGRTPEEQQAHDRALRGSRNLPFISWINGRIADWRQVNGLPKNAPLDHEAFDLWLAGGGGVL